MRVQIRTFTKAKYHNSKALRRSLEREMDDTVKPYYIEQFDKIVVDWDSVSNFGALKKFTSNQLILYVYPKGIRKEVWYYVDRGTRAHKIRAKNKPFLMFPNGIYMPKTSPVAQIGGLGNYLFILGVTSKQEVNHPGNEPREFTHTITNDTRHKAVFNNAIRRAIYETFT